MDSNLTAEEMERIYRMLARKKHEQWRRSHPENLAMYNERKRVKRMQAKQGHDNAV